MQCISLHFCLQVAAGINILFQGKSFTLAPAEHFNLGPTSLLKQIKLLIDLFVTPTNNFMVW